MATFALRGNSVGEKSTKRKKTEKQKHKLGLINLCERENKLPSVWKIITPKVGVGRKRERERGEERDKVKLNGTLRN